MEALTAIRKKRDKRKQIVASLIYVNEKLDNKSSRGWSMNGRKAGSWWQSDSPGFVVRLSRVFGSAPVVFTENHVYISFALFVYGQVLITMISAAVILPVVLKSIESLSNSIFRHDGKDTLFVVCLQMFFFISMNSTAAFLASARLKSFIEIAKRVEMVKTKLGDFSYSDKIKKKDSVLIFLCIVIFVTLYAAVILNRIISETPNDSLINVAHVAYFLSHIISNTMKLQFILMCRYIVSSFFSFNKCLQQLLNAIDLKDRTGRGHSAYLTLRKLNIAYTEIWELVEIMNHNHNGFTMLLVLVNTCVRLIITPYNAYSTLLITPLPVFGLVLEILWMMYHIFHIYLFTDPGHNVIYETLQIQRTTSKIMRNAQFCTDEFVDELKSFSTKLMIINPVFSPLGICTLSRRLIISIIGIAVTYLVIVVQLCSSEK